MNKCATYTLSLLILVAILLAGCAPTSILHVPSSENVEVANEVPKETFIVGQEKTISSVEGPTITLKFEKLSWPEYDYKGLLNITSTFGDCLDIGGNITVPGPDREVWVPIDYEERIMWVYCQTPHEASSYEMTVRHGVTNLGEHFFEVTEMKGFE